MSHMTSALRAFVWFLWQSSTVGGMGPLFFWVPFLLSSWVLFDAWTKSEVARKRLWVLTSLPPIWILTGLLGGYYWLDLQHIPVQPSPPWVKFVLAYSIVAFLLIGLATIIYLKGARLFASIYFCINSYFMLWMWLLSSMAVTGDWL